MVRCSRGGLNRYRFTLAAAVLTGCFAHAEANLTLEQAMARKPPDYGPACAGQMVVVRGIVSAPAIRFPEYSILPFQQNGYGAALDVSDGAPDVGSYKPGDEIQVQGVVSSRAGEVTILPVKIQLLGRKPAPPPENVAVEDLMGFRHLGELVRTTGQITEIGETTAGPYVLLAAKEGNGNYKLFFPHAAGAPSPVLSGFSTGDRVSVTGIAFQYAPRAPYNGWFELVVGNPANLALVHRSWGLPPLVVGGTMILLLTVGLILWGRERRLRTQRERLRKTYQLGEEILGASSIETILGQISDALP